MSWEEIAHEVQDGYDMSYQEAFTLVAFIARKLRSGGGYQALPWRSGGVRGRYTYSTLEQEKKRWR